MSSTPSTRSASSRMGTWFRHIMSCCDRDSEVEERPALQISHPTNFRREDITIPGLDPEQQRFIREKAISDAQKMHLHLQPLRSSPSGHFASPTTNTAGSDKTGIPSYEDFTTPRSAPLPSPTSNGRGRRTSVGARLDRVRAHSRKISNSFSKPGGKPGLGPYLSVGDAVGREDSKFEMEMRALIDQNPELAERRSSTRFGLEVGKVSGESWSGAESGMDLEDRDSGKGMLGRI